MEEKKYTVEEVLRSAYEVKKLDEPYIISKYYIEKIKERLSKPKLSNLEKKIKKIFYSHIKIECPSGYREIISNIMDKVLCAFDCTEELPKEITPEIINDIYESTENYERIDIENILLLFLDNVKGGKYS